MNFRRKNFIKIICLTVLSGVFCSIFLTLSVAAQIKKNAPERDTNGKLLAEAENALKADDVNRAAEIVGKILLTSPRNPAAQTLAGIVADRQNDAAQAEKHFAEAARLAPSSAELRNNYGAILLKQNKKNEAAREFAASLKINPNQSSALINLARIRFEENDLISARNLFLKAKAVAPDAEVLRALVIVSLRTNEPERAASEFKEYFQSPISGGNADFGELLFSQNLLPEAAQELKFVLASNPDDVQAIVVLSKVLTAEKNIKEAGKLLESAVARDLADAEIYQALAEVYQAAGYPENAIPAMRLAVEKSPQTESYRIRYGLLLIDSKAPAAAVIRTEEALKIFPKSARLQMLLGMAQFSQHKSNEAQTAFENALAIEPNLIPALGYLAVIFSEQGKFDEAAKIYERSVGFDDKNALLHYLLADTLLKFQNPAMERIESELKRAVELDPNLGVAYSVLGRLYVRQARWTDARVTFERGLKADSQMADALYQLGLVYARLKMPDESKATLAKFKELNVSSAKQADDERREIVRRLANTKF